jgi:hypothetical protein
MYLPSRRSLIRLCVASITAAFIFGVAGVQQVSAQQTPQQTVAQFLANPNRLLQDNPTGGPRMISLIRDLAVADPATLQPLLQLLATANKEQKMAMGSGLAQAARIVVRTNPAYANQIQVAIANTRDQDLVLAFASLAGDQPIGGPGAAGGGGAVGGQTNPLPGNPSGTGPAQPIGGNGVLTGQFGYNSSVSGLTPSLAVSGSQ